MNFIDKFFLWLVLLPKPVYQKLGINLDHLAAVLTAKLTMDNRRPVAFGNRNSTKNTKVATKATLGTMLGAFFTGLFMLFAFGVGSDILTKLTMFATMFIFMLCITLITDFTSVLIDVRDNLIILPKPISDVTFMTARLLHITIRTSIIVLPMTIPAAILLAVMQGLFTIIPFVFIVLMMSLLSIFFINAIYILILKITTPAKFQSIIGSIQIAFVMVLMAGYQLMPRLMQSNALSGASVTQYPSLKFYPPYWFSDACLLLSGKGFSADSMVSLVLSIIVPILSVWLVVRFFAPSFNRKLGMITGGSSEASAPTKRVKGTVKTTLLERMAGFLTKPGAEFAGFVFTGRMIGRSRDYKMKVFPSIGYLIVFGIVFFLQDHRLSLAAGGTKLATPLLMIIYMSSVLISAALMQLPYSDKFKAAWLFFVTPIDKPGKVISGAVKCVFVLFFVPLALLLVILGLLLQGPSSLPNMLLGCLNVLAIGSVLALIMVKNLPFSTAQEGAAGGNTFIRTMLLMLLPVGFGFAHYLISGFHWVVLFLLLITAVVPWLVFDEIKKRNWNQLKQ